MSADQDAGEFVDAAMREKPQLVVHASDRPATVDCLRTLLAEKGDLYERDGETGKELVELIRGADGKRFARKLTYHNVIAAAHRHCQPVIFKEGAAKPITLPEQVAKAYLDERGDWGVPSLAGISTAPLLRNDGTIISRSGYDGETQVFSDCTFDPPVPAHPTRRVVDVALRFLRKTFCTFPFADSPTVERDGIDVVDVTKSPGLAESTFLAALLTACCRASLGLAPGMLVNAPNVNGSGSGKGLLVRAICMIALGYAPQAGTAGHDRAEFDKRLTGNLISGAPVVFFDNMNATALLSATLASALTERPAKTRPLNTSMMVLINSAAFIALTGNGLTVSEDLVRRLLHVALDPRMEDPESRPFKSGFLAGIEAQRPQLLGALLTIWRWARQNPNALTRGIPLGSFEQWAEWVRDPLLTLGCIDPVEGMRKAKALDPKRQELTELFEMWWKCHADDAVRASELHQDVLDLLDPQKRGRQWIARVLVSMADTRAAGYVLTRQVGGGKRSVATYLLQKVQRTPHEPHEPHASDNLNAGEFREHTYSGAGARTHAGHADHADDSPHNGPRRGPSGNIDWRACWKSPEYRRVRQAARSRRLREYQDAATQSAKAKGPTSRDAGD